MPSAFDSLLSDARASLRGQFAARDAIVLTTQLAAELKFPVNSRSISLSGRLGTSREDAFPIFMFRRDHPTEGLLSGRSLNPTRQYHYEGLYQFDHNGLTKLTSTLEDMLANESPRELADYLVRAWVESDASDAVWPTAEVSEFALKATVPASIDRSMERVVCRGPGAEPLAIACMRAGLLPVLVGDEVPPMAHAYSRLIDSQVALITGHSPDTTDSSARTQDVAPTQIILPKFGLTLEEAERLKRMGNESDSEMSEWSALHYASQSNSDATTVFVANHVLHARGAAESAFRKNLIESKSLRAIVSFPPGALNRSDVPSSLLLFDRGHAGGRTSAVLCRVDADEDFTSEPGKLRARDRRFGAGEKILKALQNPNERWCRSVPYDDLAKEDYVLQVDRYLDNDIKVKLTRASRSRPPVSLDLVATVTKAQTLRSSPEDGAPEVREISPGEFPEHGYLKSGPRLRRIDPSDLSRRSRQIIRAGDILLSSKGAIGRTALCADPDPSEILVAAPSIAILRLHPEGPFNDAVAFLMYLRSPLFQAQLRAITVGTTIPNLSPTDLRKIPIVVPTVDEQRRLREAFEKQMRLQQQIDELRRIQAVTQHSILAALDLADSEGSS